MLWAHFSVRLVRVTCDSALLYIGPLYHDDVENEGREQVPYGAIRQAYLDPGFLLRPGKTERPGVLLDPAHISLVLWDAWCDRQALPGKL